MVRYLTACTHLLNGEITTDHARLLYLDFKLCVALSSHLTENTVFKDKSWSNIINVGKASVIAA